MSAGIAECLDKLDVFSSSHLGWIKKKDDPPLGPYDGVGYERLERTLEAGAGQSDDITMLALVFGVPPEPRATWSSRPRSAGSPTSGTSSGRSSGITFGLSV